MIKEKFEEISAEFGYPYTYQEEYIKSLGGSNIPITTHRLVVEYKSITILLNYEFGNTTMAEVKCSVPTKQVLPEFKVSTKSQINRLFTQKSDTFSITCADNNFKSALKEILANSKYTEIANSTQFEPQISGTFKDEVYHLKTSFYLGFNDKEQSILPSIDLHKALILYIKHGE